MEQKIPYRAPVDFRLAQKQQRLELRSEGDAVRQ